MNLRKQASEAIRKRLEVDQIRIRYQLRANRRRMADLVTEQTQMKRELAVLHELITTLK